jgi:hypothetical protein
MVAPRLLTFAAVALLCGCGRMAPLQPAPGEPLPVKPLMAQQVPTAEMLLDRPTVANPDRVDELIRRSEPRRADRFDLPPAAGAAIPPPLAAQTDDPPQDNTGPTRDDDE